MDRRGFLATSGMTVLAAALRDLPLAGWQDSPPRSKTCGGEWASSTARAAPSGGS